MKQQPTPKPDHEATLPSVFGYDNDTDHGYPERPGTRRSPITGVRVG
jgi:hypothetical protein